MSYRTFRMMPYSSRYYRARRQMRAANEQRDTTEVVLNSSIDISCGQTFGFITNERYSEDVSNLEQDFWKDTGCAALNIYDVLRQSEFYDSYASMYDQVRIDSITAHITALSWVNSNNTVEITNAVSEYLSPKSLTVITAWDRSGLDEEQIERGTVNGNSVFYCVIGKDISTYSSAKKKHLGPGNSYEITRYLYPTSQIEKNQFVSTSDLRPQYNRDNNNDYPYREFKWSKDTTGNRIAKKYITDTKFPTNIVSNPAVPFKPTLLINVLAGPDPTTVVYNDEEIGVNKLKPTTFNIEFDIAVTFRGLRYSKVLE